MMQTMPQGPRVKAIYTHVTSDEGLLQFTAGDLMTLVGDQADGWNYAYNPVTNQYDQIIIIY